MKCRITISAILYEAELVCFLYQYIKYIIMISDNVVPDLRGILQNPDLANIKYIPTLPSIG